MVLFVFLHNYYIDLCNGKISCFQLNLKKDHRNYINIFVLE